MTSPTQFADAPRTRNLALLDEMGLTDEPSMDLGESAPAPLQVQDDSIAIYHGAMSELRQLLLISAAAGTYGALTGGLRTLAPPRWTARQGAAVRGHVSPR
jgi:hypothetical protein